MFTKDRLTKEDLNFCSTYIQYIKGKNANVIVRTKYIKSISRFEVQTILLMDINFNFTIE